MRFRKIVASKASDLIAIHGARAYGIAREQARMERTNQRWTEDRFWSRVALKIAEREGRAGEIGVTGADRYPGV